MDLTILYLFLHSSQNIEKLRRDLISLKWRITLIIYKLSICSMSPPQSLGYYPVLSYTSLDSYSVADISFVGKAMVYFSRVIKRAAVQPIFGLPCRSFACAFFQQVNLSCYIIIRINFFFTLIQQGWLFLEKTLLSDFWECSNSPVFLRIIPLDLRIGHGCRKCALLANR